MRMGVRTPLLLTAAALAAATAVPATARAAPTTPASPAASAPAPAVRTVPLITGDAVRLGRSAGARTDVAVLPRDRHGAAGQFRTFRNGTRVSVVPAVALPYLGKQLDPALFDVTTLAAAPAGRLPVRVSYAAGAAHHPIPGVTVTATSGDNDTAYLTPASSRRFGRALADAVRTRSGSLFTGITAIRYAGAVTPVATPRFPMFTLRIPLVDETGAPAQYAAVVLVNVDDARKYNGFAFADNGEIRVSVPAGNYSLLAEFPQFGDDGTLTDRLVNVSDLAVTAATTARPVDARTATTAVALTGTPRPAVVDDFSVNWSRTDDAQHGGAGFGFSYAPGSRPLVAPGRPVVHGQLAWSDRWHLTAADNTYTYDLDYGADGAVPTVQQFRATAAQLATLTVRYDSDVPGREVLTTRFPARPPNDFGGFQALLPVTAPATRTEYVGGSQDVLWEQQLLGFTYFDDTTFILGDTWFDGYRSYPAGQRFSTEWERQPVHPSLDRDTGTNPLGFFCPACRAGDTLGIFVTSLADSVPGHVGLLDAYGDTPIGKITASTRFRVYRAGTLIEDEPDVTGAYLTVPPDAARYRVVYTQNRQAPWIRFGTKSTTEWTFSSGTPAANDAPAGWICPDDSVGTCAVLPLLTADYAVPVDAAGTVAPGPGSVTVTLHPTQGAPSVPVDTAAVSWSGDDGVTWTQAVVRPLGGGAFSAAVPNPTGATISLRVSGTDRTGNTITQTFVRAYAVR